MQFWRDAPGPVRALMVATAVVLVASTASAYQVSRADAPPSFSRGGAFGGAAGAGTADEFAPGSRPSPETIPDAPTTSARPDGAAAPAMTDTSDAAGSSRSDAGPSAGDAGGARTGGDPGPEPDRGTATDTGEAPAGPGLPATGVYTYAVDGWEQATGFGRRAYPEEMAVTVHRDAEDLGEREVVLDSEFSSEHEERQIVVYGPGAVAFTFEGGSVTFGPRTESSEAEYEPPMVQIPRPLGEGATRQGASRAVSSSGDTVRTEDWDVRVQGRERIDTGVGPVDTWVVTVDRKSRPGSSEQVDRHRTYWYDPDRRLWVQWYEEFHGERDFGPFTFVYETEYTATLQEFAPR